MCGLIVPTDSIISNSYFKAPLYFVLSIEDILSSCLSHAYLGFIFIKKISGVVSMIILYVFIQGHTNTKGLPLEASFSPDSRFVFSGSTDGRIHCWSTDTGSRIAVMNCEHTGPVQCVQFNPNFMMLASACTNMVSGGGGVVLEIRSM